MLPGLKVRHENVPQAAHKSIQLTLKEIVSCVNQFSGNVTDSNGYRNSADR